MNRPVILVCALADAPLAVPGSVFHHHCRDCGRAVMVAPTGQRVLREYPLALIICGLCYEACRTDTSEESAGTMEEVAREVRAARPNLRRSRN